MSKDLLIPPKITECALSAPHILGQKDYTDVCLPNKILEKYGNSLQSALKSTGCETQECVLRKEVSPGEYDKLVKLLFKVDGHTDTTLINNVNIDDLMLQWNNAFPYFYGYNFNMRDYIKHSFRNGMVLDEPDTLATINQAILYSKGITCTGCVINTDRYHGSGKHWMALFTDYRDKNNPTIEFFNSSGNAPSPEWVNWMQKTQSQMLPLLPNVQIVRVTSVRYQESKTECGTYSLYYVWARLNGRPLSEFINKPIEDKYMFEFRHHLFQTSGKQLPGITKDGKFDWENYKKNTNIEWDGTEPV